MAELPFEFTDADLKLAIKRVRKWWHPDQVAHRTIFERNQDPENTNAIASFSHEEMQRASKKFVWRQNAKKMLSDKWCRRFWEFIMRRRLGLIRFFIANQRMLIEAWRELLTKRGFHLKASDPDHRRRMIEIP